MSLWDAPRDADLDHARWRTILLAIVATLGAGVMAALILIVGDTNRQRDQALQRQSHSYEVINLTRMVAGTIAKSEASLGRFVISGDKALGTEYYDDWLSAGQQIDRLGIWLNDNPDQYARVAALKAAYQKRGAELALIALSTRYRKNDQALARYYQARDARALHRTEALIDQLVAEEHALLERRSAVADATVARSTLAVKILAGFGVLIVAGAIVLGWLMMGAIADRAIANAEAETASRRAEELESAVAAATADLHSEMREREAAEAQLRQMQKLDAVGQLTGGIAHDFNNMLAVVSGGIELARRRVVDGSGDVLRHLNSAAEGASRASALTRRLLTFARSEPLRPEPIDPDALIADMSDLLDRSLGDAITIEVRSHRDDARVYADRHGFENALLNLAVNARDAMDGRGRLTITTDIATLREREIGMCLAGDYVTVTVRDTGCGMSPEVAERVFEPFFTTKDVGKGTGLGLSQIFGFVQQSGGEIALDTAPGEGCAVTLYLPRHASEAVAPRLVAAPAPAAAALRPSEPLDILLVEDDPRVLAATLDVLEELGHRVVACNDPLHAGEAAARMPSLDLVISDVLMPAKTGPELVAELRDAYPALAVLFVTGFAGEAAEHDQFGGHAVLRKPFTIMGLAAGIARAIERRDAGLPGPVAATA